VSVGNPFFRVDHLPALILVGRPGWHIRVLLAHQSPLIGVEILEVQPFSVWTISHDHRVLALGDGPEHVGAQHESVIHRNRDIPVDAHPVPDLTLLSRSHRSPFLALRSPVTMAHRHGQYAHACSRLEHDPEKWTPVFGKDHAPTIT